MLQPEVGKEFFEQHLPVHIKEIVDLSTLKPRRKSFLDKTLAGGVVDMLFEVEFGGEDGYISLLLEHQSQPDRLMPLRLAKSFFRDDYQLIELQKIEDDELKQGIWAGSAQLIMKRMFESDVVGYLHELKERRRKKC